MWNSGFVTKIHCRLRVLAVVNMPFFHSPFTCMKRRNNFAPGKTVVKATLQSAYGKNFPISLKEASFPMLTVPFWKGWFPCGGKKRGGGNWKCIQPSEYCSLKKKKKRLLYSQSSTCQLKKKWHWIWWCLLPGKWV